MRHIKTYQIFEATYTPPPSPELLRRIRWLDKCAPGRWKQDRQTLLINVEGDFVCSRQNLEDFKGFRFGEVSGQFRCDNNQLTTLDGAPQIVGKNFDCSHNQLTTLEGAPQTVTESFDCSYNDLTTLEGAPQTVRGFFCGHNQITSLVGAPQTVTESFDCSYNDLTTLDGAPQIVGKNFDCSHNQLTTLVGAPQTVGVGFRCNDNQLISLEGVPQTVGGDVYYHNNQISNSTLKAIFDLMKRGRMNYKEALRQYWPDMSGEEREILYDSL